MNMPPKKSIAAIKAKLQIAKTKMTSALDSFLKEIESENPNFIAINHYKNTVKQRLEDLEERTYEAIDEISEEEQTELIDQLSQFHLQVDDFSQKSMQISEKQVNIRPTSISQTTTANQQLEVANTQTGRAANFSLDTANDEEDHRRPQTQSDNSSSTPETIENHQTNAADNQEDRQGSLPAASAVHTATHATADHYGIPYDLTFGPYLNTLSKMNIEPYTGDPLQWSDWRSRFDFMIGNTPLSNSQKIAYLQGLVTGKAKDAILHFHCNGQFYNDALQELERKFGKATTIVNAYIQQLLDHQPATKGHPESYINYTTFIKGMIRNLQHLGHTADLESTTNLRHAIKKLPTSDLIRWQQYIVNRRIDRPNLITFCDWLKPIAEAYELLEDNDNQQLHTLQTFTTQTSNSKGSTSQSSTCPLGDGQHQIFKCPIFIAQSPEERQMTTRNSGLCFNCLNKDHRIANCPSKKNCQYTNCNKRHNTLLHRDFQVAGNSSHLSGSRRFRTVNRNQPPEESNKGPSYSENSASVHLTQEESTNNCLQRNTDAENYRTETHRPAATLQILPINLHNQHRSTAVYALLDSGSTSSFLTKNIAEKLKLTPKTTTTLKIKGFNATQTMNSTVVDLQLSDIEDRETHNWRNVYIVDNDQLPTVKEHPKQIADKYGHLKDIKMPQLNNLNVEALLGCDMYALIIAREI